MIFPLTVALLAIFGAYCLLLRKNHVPWRQILGSLVCLIPGAMICGVAWFFPVWWLGYREGDGWLASVMGLGWRCVAAALIAGVLLKNGWTSDVHHRSHLLLLAVVHEIVGATLFGTFVMPGIGTLFGFLYAFPLMPVQILGSLFMVFIYRRLHACFLAPKARPTVATGEGPESRAGASPQKNNSTSRSREAEGAATRGPQEQTPSRPEGANDSPAPSGR